MDKNDKIACDELLKWFNKHKTIVGEIKTITMLVALSETKFKTLIKIFDNDKITKRH